MFKLSQFSKQLFSWTISTQRPSSLSRTTQYSSFLNFSTNNVKPGEITLQNNPTQIVPAVASKVEAWTPPPVNNLSEEMEMLPSKENDPMPEEPESPNSEECCMSGCRVCVYDLYEQNVEKYEKELVKWKARERRRQGETETVEEAQP